MLAFVGFKSFATECGDFLRANDYRHLPTDGQAKVPMVDYKLINQLLMALQRAVIEGHALPEGFEARLSQAQPPNPIGGVILRGTVPWSGHELYRHTIELVVRRERLAIVIEVHDLSDGRVFEMALSEEEYSKIFPFQRVKGMLISLGVGLKENFGQFTQVR